MTAIRRMLAISAVLCIAAALYGNSANAAEQSVCIHASRVMWRVTEHRDGFQTERMRRVGVLECVPVTTAVRVIVADQASPFGAVLLREYGMGGLARLIQSVYPSMSAAAARGIVAEVKLQAAPVF